MAASISSVGIIACGRLELLKRCVDSYVANLERHGRALELTVFDDSRLESDRDAAVAYLKGLKIGQSTLRYAGSTQRRRFAAALTRKGLPEKTVEFALFGLSGTATPGANRNSLLLDTIGRLAFMADEDTVCEAAPSPRLALEPAAAPAADAFEHWFFPDRRATLDAVDFSGADPFATHEAFLGRRVAGVAAAPVAATYCGFAGDGAAGSLAYLHLRGGSRERLMRSERTYRAAMETMETLRVANRATILKDGYCMAAFMGVDNRRALPPFMPSFRVEDGVFGSLLKRASSSSALLLPWAMLHAPETRLYSMDGAAAVRYFVNELVSAVIRAIPEDVSPRRIGEELVLFADSPQFEHRVNGLIRDRWKRRAEALEKLLELHGGSPAYWADDVRRTFGPLRAALSIKECPPPTDALNTAGEKGAAWKLTAAALANYGRLLARWEDIRTESERLVSSGTRLSEPV